MQKIEDDVGKDVFQAKEFTLGIKYDNNPTWYDFPVNEELFFKCYLKRVELSADTIGELKSVKTLKAFEEYMPTAQNDELKKLYQQLQKEYIDKAYKWDKIIQAYSAQNYLNPSIPKFW